MKVLRIKVAPSEVEAIYRTGYQARGGFEVRDGLPGDARLEQAQFSAEPKGRSSLVLYFVCAGDGLEEITPRLVPVPVDITKPIRRARERGGGR